MFLFNQNSNSCLGVDMGASGVKIVELAKEEERYTLKNYAIYPLMQDLRRTSDKPIHPSISEKERIQMINSSLSEAKIKCKNAYFSVSVYSSFCTLIKFPNMPTKEIAASIPFEARKYVPVPISEVFLDWSFVEPLKDSSGSKQVLIVAVPKQIINSYEKISKSTKLKLEAIEEENFSLARSLVGNDQSAVVLIDAGYRSINVSIIDEGYIRMVHNLEMGGLKLSQNIAKKLNLSLEDAEKVKKDLLEKNIKNDRSLQAEEVIHLNLRKIITEIKRIIDSYHNKFNRNVKKCILAGGGAYLVNLQDYLADKLELDVSMGDPFARISYPPILKTTLKELGPSLAVAVGLAMKE